MIIIKKIKMQITKIVSVLFFASISYAHTDFIKDGNRAELFELMDHEVLDFRITIPADEFVEMKKQINERRSFFKRQWKDDTQDNFENKWKSTTWSQPENYQIKNATLVVDINGGQNSFDEVTFSIGETSSYEYARQDFELIINGKNDLYGRKQFRISSDTLEATYLRSKLGCDIHNRLGLPSISANYISLYVNDEYWGFYILMDVPKLSWVELQYGDKNSTNIYDCNGGAVTLSVNGNICENQNKDFQDKTVWENFITSLDEANSINEIDEIFDVDQFLYEMAYEYLSGTWDHYLNTGRNFAVYKMPENYGGKWTMIHYDFDADFGQDVCYVEIFGSIRKDKDYPTWSWEEWSTKKSHLLDVLIKKDRTRFNAVMKRFVEEAFNPDVLFPRIDELKDFIRPYVKNDKTPGSNGKKPGMLNERSNYDYSMEQWEANSEFTNISTNNRIDKRSGYGLKFWILLRYRKVCTDFKLDCNPKYMDINYYYDIDRNVEGPIITSLMSYDPMLPDPHTTTQSQPPKPKTTNTTYKTITTTGGPVNTPSNDCVIASHGYPCCSSSNTKIVYQDESGDWGIENNNWCGITKIDKTSEKCWSINLGYPCCSKCIDAIYTDADGRWGIENNKWCGIYKSC